MAECCKETVPLSRVIRRLFGIANGQFPFPLAAAYHLAQLLIARLQDRLFFPEGSLGHDLVLMESRLRIDPETLQEHVQELFRSVQEGIPAEPYSSNTELFRMWNVCRRVCAAIAPCQFDLLLPGFLRAVTEE